MYFCIKFNTYENEGANKRERLYTTKVGGGVEIVELFNLPKNTEFYCPNCGATL
ncbi:MAG: hypothetical protein R3Y26_11790 [Rikenellaceae bacterium]